MDPESANDIRELIASLASHNGRVVEIDCPRPDCDGNLAWLIGRTTERACRKCGGIVHLDDTGIVEALVAASEVKGE